MSGYLGRQMQTILWCMYSYTTGVGLFTLRGFVIAWNPTATAVPSGVLSCGRQKKLNVRRLFLRISELETLSCEDVKRSHIS